MENEISVVDKIDGLIWDLSFEDKIKEDNLSSINNSVCGGCNKYTECHKLIPYHTKSCKLFKKRNK